MALRVDRPRFRGIFGRLDLPPAVSEELLDAVEEEVDRSESRMATKQDLAMQTAELRSLISDLEVRMMRMMLVQVGLTVTVVGVAAGVIIAVLS